MSDMPTKTYMLPVEVVRENVERLKAERGIRNNSELARLAGMKHPRTVNRLMSGEQDNPELDTLAAIAQALDVALWQLLMPMISTNREISRPLRGGLSEGAQAVAAVYVSAPEAIRQEIKTIVGYAADRDDALHKPRLLGALREVRA